MNEKLSIQDITNLLAEKHGISKEVAENFVKEFFSLIEQALETDRIVKIKGLGTFKLVDVESRESINVNTGERFQIQGHTKVSFIPEASLKDIINKPFAHFETVALNEDTVLEDTLVDENAESIEDTDLSEEEEHPRKTQLSAEEIIALELEKARIEFPSSSLSNEKETSVKKSMHATTEKDLRCEESQENIRKLDKEKSPIPYLIAIIIAVLLLCGGAVLFIYFPDILHPAEDELIEKRAPKLELTGDTIADTDITVAEKAILTREVKDTVLGPLITSEKEEKKTTYKKEGSSQVKVEVMPDSVTYEIKGTKTTYTMQKGETLTKVALRFYGTKALWPYIVQHNRGIIKNSDNVPYGIKLKIPELVKK